MPALFVHLSYIWLIVVKWAGIGVEKNILNTFVHTCEKFNICIFGKGDILVRSSKHGDRKGPQTQLPVPSSKVGYKSPVLMSFVEF